MRILGITLPENKRMEFALTAIYGIGQARARHILATTKVALDVKPKDLTVDQENAIRKLVESYKIEGDLKREVASNIKRLKDIRKTMGSGRRKEEKT